uniref:F-box domain-containing protein n=1 Tax=Brassica oleracea var. oleracea TaxID=109376 RepID=A0A0D3D4X5_BRAOL
MSKGENSVSIPMDLINEIFSRLPAKSVARFSCLSKQWRDMLDRSYFKELFFTRSSVWPRLLFSVKRDGYDDLCLFSSPQPRDLYEKSSSLVVTADFHMNTGQSALLPEDNRLSSINYLVFDPVDKQFKVLNMSDLILTLGTGEDSWRQIYCPLNNLSTYGLLEGIRINGVLYYFATQKINVVRSYLIVCFDVRKCSLKLCMSVVRDVEDPNSEWSEHVYTFRKTNQCVGCSHVSTLWKNQIVAGVLSVVGVTATGDIVLCMEDVSKPLYVFYLNIERKTLQRVEFRTANNEAFEKCSSKVILSVDHVEDLNFINMET